jgi:hypothetical protein
MAAACATTTPLCRTHREGLSGRSGRSTRDVLGKWWYAKGRGRPSAGEAAVVPFIGWWWISRRAKVRQNRLDALKNATRLGEVALAERLLVIRAIDDEASLTLAFGAIVNYVTSRFITYTLLLYLLLLVIIVPANQTISWFSENSLRFIYLAIFPLAMMLFGMLMVSRSVHGRELARSPIECQVNTQSTPDAKRLSEVITLVRHTYVKSLRHGIYDHEDCAKTISDWVHSQLPALPVN